MDHSDGVDVRPASNIRNSLDTRLQLPAPSNYGKITSRSQTPCHLLDFAEITSMPTLSQVIQYLSWQLVLLLASLQATICYRPFRMA